MSTSIQDNQPEMHIPAHMSQTSFYAMGTTVSVLLPEHAAQVEAAIIEKQFLHWEKTLTRFDAGSALSYLNQHAGQMVTVDPLVFDVLSAALQAAQATDGIFDPAMLRQIRQAGYDRSFEHISEHMPQYTGEATPGGQWKEIVLQPESHSVYMPLGTELDLGGIAKGMAVDAALQTLREHGISSALINAGGDLGVWGLPPDTEQWIIATPQNTTIGLRQGAIATSGITWRHWYRGDRLWHHLIDPRTGMSASNTVAIVTVAAGNCLQAEVAAKAAFILGLTSGMAFLQHHGLHGIFVHADGSLYPTHEWDESDLHRKNV